MSNKLRRKWLDQAIQDFHDPTNTIEVNKQLDGIIAASILTQPTIRYELPTNVRLLSQPIDEFDQEKALKIRAMFSRNLTRPCQRQESR